MTTHPPGRPSPPPPGGWQALWLLALLLAPAQTLILAAPMDGTQTTVRSRSGQFVVQSPLQTTPSLGQALATTNRNFITLQPDPVAVSAERIKQRLLREFELQDRWQGKIHVRLHPNRRSGADYYFVARWFGDGWQYSLELPERIEAMTFVQAIVQALLTELANRMPGPYPVELPVWLVEGIAAELLATIGPDLVLETNPLLGRLGAPGGELIPSVRYQKFTEHRRTLQKYLNIHPPLTFNALCLPTPALLAPAERQLYTASAQVFFTELWALPNGRAMLLSMLGRLSRTLNWQTAFLAAFQNSFRNLAEVEKWWAVTATQFTGRTEAAVWSPADTLARLDQALTVAVDIRRSAAGRPARETVSLQRVLGEMGLQQQLPVLRTKYSQLELVQSLAPPALLPLINAYLSALGDYLEQRPKAGYTPAGKGQPAISARALVHTAVARLDALDARRASAQQALRSNPEPTPSPDSPRARGSASSPATLAGRP